MKIGICKWIHTNTRTHIGTHTQFHEYISLLGTQIKALWKVGHFLISVRELLVDRSYETSHGDRRWIVRDVSIIYLKNYMRPGDEWKQPPLPTAVKVGEWKSRQLIAIWSNGQEEWTDGQSDRKDGQWDREALPGLSPGSTASRRRFIFLIFCADKHEK